MLSLHVNTVFWHSIRRKLKSAFKMSLPNLHFFFLFFDKITNFAAFMNFRTKKPSNRPKTSQPSFVSNTFLTKIQRKTNRYLTSWAFLIFSLYFPWKLKTKVESGVQNNIFLMKIICYISGVQYDKFVGNGIKYKSAFSIYSFHWINLHQHS